MSADVRMPFRSPRSRADEPAPGISPRNLTQTSYIIIIPPSAPGRPVVSIASHLRSVRFGSSSSTGPPELQYCSVVIGQSYRYHQPTNSNTAIVARYRLLLKITSKI